MVKNTLVVNGHFVGDEIICQNILQQHILSAIFVREIAKPLEIDLVYDTTISLENFVGKLQTKLLMK